MGRLIQEVRLVYNDAKVKASQLLDAILGLESSPVTTSSCTGGDGYSQDTTVRTLVTRRTMVTRRTTVVTVRVQDVTSHRSSGGW